MKNMLLAAAITMALAGCGESATDQGVVPNSLAKSVDEQAAATAVDRAVDQKALQRVFVGTAERMTRGAVEDAIQEVAPVPAQEMQTLGAAIAGRALIEGIANAADEEALGAAVESVSEPAQTR